LGFEKGYMSKTVYELLMGECRIDECVIRDVHENLDILPSDVDLAGAEIELLDEKDKESKLRKELEKIEDQYDFIIVDCPPSLNLLTINALTAANTVLVPIQCEYYALEGLSQIIQTVDLVKKKLNPNLELEGVVFTMYDARTNLSLEVVENVKNYLKGTIYKTIIPRNVRLAEAPSHGMPINFYDTRSSGAESYRMLAAEVISRGDI
jgi:chromosome partitioning protein